MKLEVGKWCRTKNGTIFKIIGGNVDMWEIDIDYSYLSKCENEDYNSYAYNKNNSLFEYLVVKTGYNIIDILEVGDYVNGHEVKSKQSGVKRIDIGEDENYVWLYENDIKSIVTKEAFSSVEYRMETN